LTGPRMQHRTKQLQTMAEVGSTDLKMLEVVSTVRMMQHQKMLVAEWIDLTRLEVMSIVPK
jgi:hypothetical protein